jgi:hypothetical protein
MTSPPAAADRVRPRAGFDRDRLRVGEDAAGLVHPHVVAATTRPDRDVAERRPVACGRARARHDLSEREAPGATLRVIWSFAASPVIVSVTELTLERTPALAASGRATAASTARSGIRTRRIAAAGRRGFLLSMPPRTEAGEALFQLLARPAQGQSARLWRVHARYPLPRLAPGCAPSSVPTAVPHRERAIGDQNHND